MTYEESLNFLHSMPRIRSKPGVDRMLRFCAYLGNPQRKLSGRFLHVAGTNGKGSACAMLTSVLQAAGLHIGTFVSPFIMEFRERISLNGTLISEEEVCEYAMILREAVQRMEEDAGEKPIEFELICGMGLLFFADRMPDLIVLEAGMGGRNDPTNIVRPLLSVIMRIDYDHTELLGAAIGEIASEKAGIIKPGIPAVIYPEQYPDAMQVLTEACRRADAPCRIPDMKKITETAASPFSPAFQYDGDAYCLSLAGRHQILNASCVLEAVNVLRENGWSIRSEAVQRGLRQAFLPARLELLSNEPIVLLDGAHNASGVQVLSAALRRETAGRPLFLLCGMLEDKHPEKALLPVFALENLKYAACVPVNSPRSAEPERLCALFEANSIPGGAYQSCAQALDSLLCMSDSSGAVVCFGSLYLAADIRRYFGKTLPSSL